MCINKHQRLASETTFLLGLTQVEEMLISAVMPIMCIYRLPHGQYGYSGHVINLHQDVLSVESTLKARPTMLAFRLVIICCTKYFERLIFVRWCMVDYAVSGGSHMYVPLQYRFSM